MTTGLNFELPMGSPITQRIVAAVQDRKKFSRQKMSDRHKAWRSMEEQSLAYIKEKDVDKLRKADKKNKGTLDYVTIEVPYSYGMMMTAHTYLTSVFLGRSPALQFTGRHGEAQQNVMAVEALMDYQMQVGKQLVPHYLWIHDALQYGVGIVGTYWDEEQITVTNIVERPETILGLATGRLQKVKEIKRMTGYEGNKLFNIKPYKFLPDPRIPLYRFQEGEFCGWETEISWSECKQRAAQGKYFNLDALEKVNYDSQDDTEQGTSAQLWPTPEEQMTGADGKEKNYVHLTEMVIQLVPAEWKLGKSEDVEKWVFTIGNNKVLIAARPLGEYHNQYPFALLVQEFNAYSLHTRGVMEQLQPMNDILTWLFNSHFYNVRTTLNNQFVYDPSKIVSADLLDPEPGKRIRLRPEAYGQDVRSAVTQLSATDVTGRHMDDFTSVTRLMEQMQGITANLMGMVNPGGRKTATEVRASSSSAANRLKTIAEYMSALGYSSLAQIQLQATQQHYSGDKRFKIIGNIVDSDPFVQVTPESIAGFYDYVPVDGTEPIDRFAQANLWKELMAGLAADQQMAMQFDRAGMFTWVAQLAGMRNIKQFRVNAQSNTQLAQQAQAGNMVPVDSSLASLMSQPNQQEPGQIPGLGPTG